jgi:hypothetical protein
MIDISPNKTLFGKRVPEFPWKAQLDGAPLAVGTTKAECMENAVVKLKAIYKAAQAPMVMVQAKDGTIFVARWTDEAQAEYWIYRNGERGGGSVFACSTSLQRYMENHVRDYNSVTEVAA